MKLRFIVPALLLALPVARAQDAAPVRAEPADRVQRDAISLAIGGGRLVLRPLLDNAVRVRFTRGDAPEAPSLILTERAAMPAFRVSESAKTVTLELAELHATVDRATGTVTFIDANGRVLLRELPGTRRIEAGTVQG